MRRQTRWLRLFVLIRLQTAQVSETLSACVGPAKHAGIELSFKFWDRTMKTGTNNRKHNFPPAPEKGFSFQKHTLCSVPAKRNTWYSFSVLAYIKSFLLDARQAADLGLLKTSILISFPSCNLAPLLRNPWKTGGDSTGHKETLGLACPNFMISARITMIRYMEGSIFLWNANLSFELHLRRWITMYVFPPNTPQVS